MKNFFNFLKLLFLAGLCINTSLHAQDIELVPKKTVSTQVKMNLSKPTSKPTPKSGHSTNNTNSKKMGKNKDRRLFDEAFKLYKSGKIEESKAILNKLTSYENPYKVQSVDILKNLNR